MRVVRTRRYMKDMRRLAATEAEIHALEEAIVNDPTLGDVIPGLQGIRKLRFGLAGRGKRGGGRAIYFVLLRDGVVLMLFAYSKARQSDLNDEQRRLAIRLVKEIENG